MDEIEQFRKTDLERQKNDVQEVKTQFERSDHIVINDDLEYSDNSAENESVRKSVLSEIQEEEENSLLHQQNGQSQAHDYINRAPDSPIKIKFRRASGHQNETWFEQLMLRYEHKYILLIFVSYFSLGTKILTDVALKEMFINFYGVEINPMINLTWTFRIIYGILADNLCILSILGFKGSSKRLYLIVLGSVNLVTIFIIFFWQKAQDQDSLTFITAVMYFTNAFWTTIVDGIIQQKAREDMEFGAHDLQLLACGSFSFGGIIGALLSMIISNKQWCFLLGSSLTMIKVLAALQLDNSRDYHLERLGISAWFSSIKKCLCMPSIYGVLLFFMLQGIIPTFYQIDEMKHEQVQYSDREEDIQTVLEFLSQMVGTIIFALFLRQKDFKQLITFSVSLQVLNGFMTLVYVLKFNELLNISNFHYLQLTNLAYSCLQIAFNYLPIFILFTFITPDNNETTIYVLLYSSYCFFNYTIRPFFGNILTELVFTDQDLKKPAILHFVLCFLPYFFVRLIPDKEMGYRDINDVSTGNKTIQLDLTDKEGDDSKKQFEKGNFEQDE